MIDSNPTSETKTFALTDLIVKNFQRLKLVSLSPSQRAFVIAGRNGAGKTSVQNAIAAMLGGKRLVPEQPIRDGETAGFVRGTLVGDDRYVVERSFTRKRSGEITTKLSVTGPDGVVSSPQTVLDALLGDDGLAFDPLAFCRMKPKEQAEVLLKLGGVDLADLNTKREGLFNQRTVVGRDEKAAKARLGGMTRCDDTPDKETLVSELMAELSRRETVNRAAEKLDTEAADAATAAARSRKAVTEAQESLAIAKQKLLTATECAAKCSTECKAAEERARAARRKDTEEIREQITNAEALNQKVRDNTAYTEAEAEAQSLDYKYDELSERMEKVDAEKIALLTQMVLPIKGLACDEGDVMLYGLPLEQACKSDKIKIGMAVGIAQNPRVRLMMIEDGSLLGDDALATIDAMANAAEMLVLIEYAMRNDGDKVPCHVIIEDGASKSVKAGGGETGTAEVYASGDPE